MSTIPDPCDNGHQVRQLQRHDVIYNSLVDDAYIERFKSSEP